MNMRAQGVLGAIEVKVAIGSGGVVGEVGDEVTCKPVAAPHAEVGAPIIGERLLIGASARHGKHARNTCQRRDNGFRETRLGDDEHLAEQSLLLHGGDGRS